MDTVHIGGHEDPTEDPVKCGMNPDIGMGQQVGDDDHGIEQEYRQGSGAYQ